MHGDTRAQKKPRAFKECEAEAFAFMVCDFLGIDIAYCSVPYLESWAERKDSKTLETCVQNAWRVAQKLAKEIEAVAAAAEVEAVAAAAEVEAVAAAAEIEAGEDKRDAFAGVPRLTEKMRARYKKGLARGFAGADLATYMTGDCSGRRFDALVSVIDALAGGIRLAA